MQKPSSGNLKVFVGGIAAGTTETDLKDYFSAYGKVKHLLFNRFNYSDFTGLHFHGLQYDLVCGKCVLTLLLCYFQRFVM